MLEQVLRHIRNWFVSDVHRGTFTAENGSIALPFLLNGQYYRIVGSVLNDGVYLRGEEALADETFTGEIWALAIPRQLLLLVADIEKWQEKNGEAAASPYQSESFGGYSYTKATEGEKGGGVAWTSAFRSHLNAWRKI